MCDDVGFCEAATVLVKAREDLEKMPGLCTCRAVGYLCPTCRAMQALDRMARELRGELRGEP